MELNQVKTVFLNDKQIRGLQILAQMHVEELKLANENPVLIEIYETTLGQLARSL